MLASTFLAVSALFAGSAVAAKCSRSYTAVEGDICDSISATHNVSTYQLATVNFGTINTECNNLVPGKSYCLGWEGSDCSTTTTVQSGDSCEIIQNKAGINATLLYLNNPQINQDCSNIYVGEVLCTEKTAQVPQAPVGAVPATAIPATATPAVASVKAAIAKTSAIAKPTAPVVAAAVAPTPAPAAPTTTHSSAAPSSTAAEEEDDDDLPWCDEL